MSGREGGYEAAIRAIRESDVITPAGLAYKAVDAFMEWAGAEWGTEWRCVIGPFRESCTPGGAIGFAEGHDRCSFVVPVPVKGPKP